MAALSPTNVLRKTYLTDALGTLKVPMREVVLSTGASILLYDTSGPYTDENLRTDVRAGLPALRAPWTAERAARAGSGAPTQLGYARRGETTAEMEFIALREGVSRTRCARRSPPAAR